MSERVSVRDGVLPVIVVAPHGSDDPYTDIIAETIADKLDCFAVINRGWQRADTVDVANDQANCNSISHCHEDVVKDEFLDPLVRYANRAQKIVIASGGQLPFFLKGKMTNPLSIIIHGVGDDIRKKVNDKKMDFIFGYGAGKPDRSTCQLWRRNALAWVLTNAGLFIWQGKAGSQFAGWGKENLNQIWRAKYPGTGCESLQIEIIRSPWRESALKAKATGSIIADAILEATKIKDMTPFMGDLGIPSC